MFVCATVVRTRGTSPILRPESLVLGKVPEALRVIRLIHSCWWVWGMAGSGGGLKSAKQEKHSTKKKKKKEKHSTDLSSHQSIHFVLI